MEHILFLHSPPRSFTPIKNATNSTSLTTNKQKTSKLYNTVILLTLFVTQLLMTLAMTGVVIYMYTVIAFNFFRKFYVRELSEGVVRDNCDTMWQVRKS